jgi:hypothetical protein
MYLTKGPYNQRDFENGKHPTEAVSLEKLLEDNL